MRDSMSKRWMRCALAVASAAALTTGCAEEGTHEPVEQVSESRSPEAPAAEPQHLVVSEFVATFDAATGEFSIEELPFEEWQSANGVSPDGIRAASQPLYCQQRLGPELRLSSDAGSIAFDPVGCGLAANAASVAFPYSALGAFCANVIITNRSPRRFDAVYAELVDVSPPEYAGYRHPYGSGVDPATVAVGANKPEDTYGLWSFGEVAPAGEARESVTTQWVLQNGGGSFRFFGRILVPIVETHDGIDNDCDGRVDNSIGVYGEGEACLSDDDCYSGACADGFCAAACADGFYGIGCGDECPGGAANPCYGNGTCNDGAGGDGSCACEAPFGGSDCGDCDAAHYGANCAYECPGGAANACNGSGTCDAGISGLGTCACDAGAHGDACEFSCTDGVQNGDEWGVDCGDVCGSQCFQEEVKFTAFDFDARKAFSWAIASDGSRMVAGAVGESTEGSNGEGAVYVYDSDGSDHTQSQRIDPPLPQPNAQFGYAVSTFGDYMLVGEPFAETTETTRSDAGRAHVYRHDGTAFVYEATFMLPGAEVLRNDYEFGTAVAMGDGVAFVAAPNARCCHVSSSGASQNNGNGAVYVYERDTSGSWSRTQTLQQTHLGNNGRFGRSLDTDGERLVIGRYRANSYAGFASRTGDAFLYQRDTSGDWVLEQSLTPPAGVLNQNDEYGLTVRIDGEVVVISAPKRETANGNNTGSVFVWRKNGSSWDYQELIEPEGHGGSSWGQRVDVAGDRVFVVRNEKIYSFDWNGTGYDSVSVLGRPPGPRASQFGGGISADRDGHIFVSARFESNRPERGTVFVYDVAANASLSFAQRIFPTNVQVGDAFGWEVEMDSNGRVIAGAYGEDIRLDNGSFRTNAGAAYVFSQDGGVWSDEAKLTASTIQSTAYFGYSVDIDGDVIAVSAHRMDVPNAAGNDRDDYGAVFVFRFDGTTWNEVARIDNPYVEETQTKQFGRDVELQGEWLFVSSDRDESGCANIGQVDMFRFNASGTPTGDNLEAWEHQGRLDPSAPCGANFGLQLDSDGQRLVIGARNWQNSRGRVLVYDYTGASWVNSAVLSRASAQQNGAELGSSVSVQGDVIAAGERGFDLRSNGHSGSLVASNSGRVTLFRFEGGVWAQEATLYNPVPEADDRMGHSVSIEGDFVVSGAIGGDPTVDLGDGPVVQTDAGEVHVFRYASATDDWGHEQTISGSDVDQYDQFGRTVSIRGGQIAVGAVFEAILGAEEAGAAYVYR